jgi:hypothetical protein
MFFFKKEVDLAYLAELWIFLSFICSINICCDLFRFEEESSIQPEVPGVCWNSFPLPSPSLQKLGVGPGGESPPTCSLTA